ncbi:hypothetical protein RB195_004694 [Necator americanus]|uniref:SCP domain-containing protein n=1 Tax=Necator americanus TaxID=51031 RepID=A0ABR1BNM4_NECAM
MSLGPTMPCYLLKLLLIHNNRTDRLLSVLTPNNNSSTNGGIHVQNKQTNGASNGNLFPLQFVTVEDSASSRSTSPLPPQMPSPTAGAVPAFASTAGHIATSTASHVSMAGPSTNSSPHSVVSNTAQSGGMSSSFPHKGLRRQYTPVAPDYHRTHVHISTTPYTADFYQPQVRSQQGNYKPSIYIERGSERPVMKQHYVVRDTYKSPLDSSMSAPMGQSTFHVQIGGVPPHIRRYGQQNHPVIRTMFSAAPLKSILNINVSPINAVTDTRAYRLDVAGRDGVSSVHGIPGQITGVQNIMVDPDMSHRGYIGYEDELRPKHPTNDVMPSTSKEQSMPVRHDRLERTYGVALQHPATRTETSQNSVTRCTSPLPESICSRLKQQKYEKYMKPCKPRMFCFFMEQHVERLLAQYKERMKRAHQLQREMEAANLPESMKQKMLDFLQQKESRFMRLRRQKMNKDMFEVLQHIGVGAFGRVSLVKKIANLALLNSAQEASTSSEKCRIPEFPAEHISAIDTFFLQIRTLAAKGENYSTEISLGPGGQMFGLRFSHNLYRKAMSEVETFGTLNPTEYGLFRLNRTFNYGDAYEGKYTAVDGLANLLETIEPVKNQMIYPNATAYGCGMTVFQKENNECEMYVVCIFDKSAPENYTMHGDPCKEDKDCPQGSTPAKCIVPLCHSQE